MNRIAREGLALVVIVAFCWAVIAIACALEPFALNGTG